MDKVLGGTNGYAPLLEDGNPAPLRKHLFDPQQRVIRQSSLTCRKADLESSAIMKGPNQGPDHCTPAEERTMLWMAADRPLCEQNTMYLYGCTSPSPFSGLMIGANLNTVALNCGIGSGTRPAASG